MKQPPVKNKNNTKVSDKKNKQAPTRDKKKKMSWLNYPMTW